MILKSGKNPLSGGAVEKTVPNWESEKSYAINDKVKNPTTNEILQCIIAHTSEATLNNTELTNWIYVLEEYYYLTQEQYNSLVDSGIITDENKYLYITPNGASGGDSNKKIICAIAVEAVDTTSNNYQYLLTDYTVHKMIAGTDTDVTNSVCINRIRIEEAQYDALPQIEKDKDYVWYII